MHDIEASLKKRQAMIHLRAALRHGDGVLTRRVHPGAFTAYWRAMEARNVAEEARRTMSSASEWHRAAQRGALALDAARAGAVVLGVAGAVMLTGETLTLTASLMISFLPGVLFLVKSVAVRAQLQALQVDARRVLDQRLVVEARRRWLHAADVLAALLLRSLHCSIALYEHERFRSIMHFTHRANVDQLVLDDLKDALVRAGNVERIIARPAPRHLPSLGLVAQQGWRRSTAMIRRCAMLIAFLSSVCSVISAGASRSGDAVIFAVVCSVALGVHLLASARGADLARRVIVRESMRTKYPSLVETVDERIIVGLEKLIENYAKGIDFQIIPDEDIETQLRLLLDQRIAAIGRIQVPADIIDLDADESAHRNN